MRLIDCQPSLPESRPDPSFDSSGLHMTDTSSIPGMHSREALSVQQDADNPVVRRLSSFFFF